MRFRPPKKLKAAEIRQAMQDAAQSGAPAPSRRKVGITDIGLAVSEPQDYLRCKATLRAILGDEPSLCHFRDVSLAVRGRLESAYAGLISAFPECTTARSSKHYLWLQCPDFVCSISAGQKSTYSSLTLMTYAVSAVAADQVALRAEEALKDVRILEPMFTIEWCFSTNRGRDSVVIEEMADDVLLDASYPVIEGGVHAFIQRYLSSSEPVLILQGPPGTGKTRLIRAILGAITARKGSQSTTLYTGDTKLMESDGLFVQFITDEDDAFVIEDADHIMRSRAAGNEHLHRFLTIADGVVRAQARKIILSTNLPNIGDLDDALIRPGRCFARVVLRKLNEEETNEVINGLAPDETVAARMKWNLQRTAREHTLADIYKELGSP